MRQKGAVFEYEKERNADLIRAFRNELRSCGSIVLPELLKRVVSSPSQRFWISPERASIVISAMMNGKPLNVRRGKKREMYEEIFRRVKDYKTQCPETPIQQIVEKVICQQAPEFYLTPESACVIISKIKNGRYNR